MDRADVVWEQNLYSAVACFVASSGPLDCLLLVHPHIDTLVDAVQELSSSHDWPRLCVGQELSVALTSEPHPNRPRAAQRWFGERLRGLSPGPVLCTEIDLLFEPSLELDPLSLFCTTSRIARLVVAWPGSYHADVLAYAVPEHAHYRTWRQPRAQIEVLSSQRSRYALS